LNYGADFLGCQFENHDKTAIYRAARRGGPQGPGHLRRFRSHRLCHALAFADQVGRGIGGGLVGVIVTFLFLEGRSAVQDHRLSRASFSRKL
jgi:hypothetical protein